MENDICVDPNSGTNLPERTPEAKLKGHVEYLFKSVNNLGGRCSVFANGTQCETFEQFMSAIQNQPQALDTIRDTLKCGRSPSAPINPLILDLSKLHQEGETHYQKILDDANKENPYYLGLPTDLPCCWLIRRWVHQEASDESASPSCTHTK
jgi:hypothetical protein